MSPHISDVTPKRVMRCPQCRFEGKDSKCDLYQYRETMSAQPSKEHKGKLEEVLDRTDHYRCSNGCRFVIDYIRGTGRVK